MLDLCNTAVSEWQAPMNLLQLTRQSSCPCVMGSGQRRWVIRETTEWMRESHTAVSLPNDMVLLPRVSGKHIC